VDLQIEFITPKVRYIKPRIRRGDSITLRYSENVVFH